MIVIWLNRKKEIIIVYLLLIIVTLLLGIPLLSDKIPNGHDSIFHLFRCYTTGIAIKDGQFIPMINPDMIGGFGYAMNMFYGIFVTYIVTFLSLFIKPIGLSINLVILFTIFFSGLFTYFFVKDITNHKKVSVLAAIVYMTSPYLLFDIYIRMALGEIMSFACLPLLFHGLYNVIHGDQTKWYLITIGASLLLLSHTVSTFMIAIFCFLYLLFYLKQIINIKVTKKLMTSLLFVLFISLPTLFPLLQAKILGDYMVFDSNYMKTTGFYMESHAIQLLGNQDSIMSMIAQGIFLIMVVLFFILFRQRKKDERHKILFPFLSLAFFSFILTLPIIPWSRFPDLFSTIQFPWRFLQLSSFFLAISIALVYDTIPSKKMIKYMIITIVTCLFIAIPFIKIGIEKPGIDNELVYSNRLKKRGNIARSTGSASAEYLPRNAIYHYEYLKKHPMEPIFLKGNGTIQLLEKKGTSLQFHVIVEGNNAIIELPFIYYPGYKVMNGKKNLNTFETENGLLGINLNRGVYDITSHYRGSNIMIIAYCLSFLSSIIFIFVVIMEKRNIKRIGKKG